MFNAGQSGTRAALLCNSGDGAVALAMFALTMKLTISANLLILLGIPYSLEGGILLAKIHPGTYVAAIAMLMRAAACRRGTDDLFFLLRQVGWLSVYLGALLFCIVYAGILTGTGGIATLIDTFLPAAMIGFALSAARPEQLGRLRALLRVLFLLNAVIGLGEAAAGAQLIPMPTYADVTQPQAAESLAEFRPTALYDHPLTAAAATMLGLMLRAETPGAIRVVGDVVLFAALLAFGGRTALLVFIVAASATYVCGVTRKTMRRRIRGQDLWPALAVPALALPVALVAFGTGMAGRLQAHLYWDPSAQSRIDQFNILRSLSFEQVLLGCRRADLLRLVEPLRLSHGVNAIEDFWLLIFATLGALCFPVFLCGVAALVGGLWRAGDARGRLMVVTLLVVASTSNSLGRKSILLMVLVACVAASGRGWVIARADGPPRLAATGVRRTV